MSAHSGSGPHPDAPDQAAAGQWLDAAFAAEWAAGDIWADLLRLPRELSVALVRTNTRPPDRIVDAGSGPGAMLGMFLSAFPSAHGLWTDVSPGMLDQARGNLAAFGERVAYRLGDLRDLPALIGPRPVDVVMTSRAIHHLSPDEQRDFYRQAAGRLSPGGWLINIDHTETSEDWSQRYRSVREQFTRPNPTRKLHPHDYPFMTPAWHLDALREAGFPDPAIAWKALSLCLLVARKAN
jgi:trans-aconitate methyltransferase